ncbi:MAG: PD-(D/E)XK nuclease family protein, partial [Canibacter sp.]
IVDWKTGRAPRTTAEQRDRFYQLDLYRHAYALWSRTDPKLIDAVLYYVADDRELSMPMQHTLAELEDKWIASQHELDGD